MGSSEPLETYDDYRRQAHIDQAYLKHLRTVLQQHYGTLLSAEDAEIYQRARTTSEIRPYVGVLGGGLAYAGVTSMPRFKLYPWRARLFLGLGALLLPPLGALLWTPSLHLVRVEEYFVLKYYRALRKTVLPDAPS